MLEGVSKKPLMIVAIVIAVIATLVTVLFFTTQRTPVSLDLSYVDKNTGIEVRYPYEWSIRITHEGTDETQFVIEKGYRSDRSQIIVDISKSGEVEVTYSPNPEDAKEDRAVYEAVKDSVNN